MDASEPAAAGRPDQVKSPPASAAPRAALARALALAAACGAAGAAAIVGSAVLMRAGAPVDRGAVALAAWCAFGALAAAIGAAWLALRQRFVEPIAALAEETRFLADARAGAIDVAQRGALTPVAAGIDALAGQLAAARHEIDRSVAAATARVEEQKARLEAILRDLSEGVLVCSLDHRILLYNHVALGLLHVSGELGLGRSLFRVLAREPVLHAFEQLAHRGASGGTRENTAALVCATADSRNLLQGRMSLIADAAQRPTGYVLTLQDATREITELGRRDALLRRVSEGLRAPLANLRAAAETLAAFPALAAAERRAFDEVVLREAASLSQHLESLDREYRALGVGDWPLADIHSVDLFNWAIRRLGDAGKPRVTMVGLPLWLRGDSHSLALACEALLRNVAAATGRDALDIEALLGDRRVYIDISWDGAPLAMATLDAWLKEPLAGALGAQTLGEVLARHGSEIWSRVQRPGRALLRVPVPAPTKAQFEPPPEAILPARPEFYDFDLLHLAPGDRAALLRPLRSFSYVVFDTETTGLNPSGGDEIISVGAVRVVNGRILTGETFSRLIHPGRPIPPASIRFHGITDAMVADAPPAAVVLPQFHAFCAGAVLVAHSAAFDLKFLRIKEAECGVRFENLALDTMLISAFLYRDIADHSLDAIARRLGIEVAGRHTALGDALATAAVFVRLIDVLESRGVTTLEGLVKASNMMLEIKARQSVF